MAPDAKNNFLSGVLCHIFAGRRTTEEERGGRARRGGVRESWALRDGREEERGRERVGAVSDGGRKSTWELLLPIWDVEERPEAMQHEETVNAMTLENVFAYKQHFEQQTKKEGKGDSSFGKDRKLQKKRFEAEDDNCCEALHSVRFERGPMVEPDGYWSRVPLRRKETFRHLPLEQDGCEGLINENVITRAHDRSLPLRLRMFSKANFAKKGFSASMDAKEPAADWAAPRAVLVLQEALCNFGDVYRQLWPLDNTPRRLQRVLIHYGYGAKLGGGEKEKCQLMEEFCDRVVRENSGRAVREKLPLSYRQAKERWRDCVEEETGRDGAGQQARAEDARKEEKKGSKGGGGGNGNRLRDGMRDSRVAAVDGDPSKTARFQGNLVCFHYNNKTTECTRKAEGDGCENGRGGIFAHVCNFQMGGGRMCFGKHKRHDKR